MGSTSTGTRLTGFNRYVVSGIRVHNFMCVHVGLGKMYRCRASFIYFFLHADGPSHQARTLSLSEERSSYKDKRDVTAGGGAEDVVAPVRTEPVSARRSFTHVDVHVFHGTTNSAILTGVAHADTRNRGSPELRRVEVGRGLYGE